MRLESEQAAAAVAAQLANNQALCDELARRYERTPPRLVITCARGSSDHAAAFAKYLIEVRLGLPVASAAPAVGSIYRRRMDLRDCVLLCISQSGQSPDLVENAYWARQQGAFVVSLLNVTDSPLADASNLILPLRAGPELAVAATKSYIASLAALVQITARLADDAALASALAELPGQLQQASQLDWSRAAGVLAQRSDLLVVGRGMSLGIAREAALKLKETSALHAEAFSGAELMHGPVALVRPEYPVLLFSQPDETAPSLQALVDDLRAKGARVFAAGAGPAQADDDLPSLDGIHPTTAPIALVQTFYAMADQIASLRGLDPDQPHHLQKVTHTR